VRPQIVPWCAVPRSYDTGHDEVPPVSDEVSVDVMVAALTDQQRTLLQDIYDFREHATWPKFITIDRPIHRGHRAEPA
jgi:hypothetical protein